MMRRPDVHVHIHVDDQDLSAKLDDILNAINYLKQQGVQTQMDLTELQAAVSADTDVVNSAVTLINNLADQIEAAAGDPAAVAQVVADLRANNEVLASAVAANTPAAPAEA